jgi:hypothetical protein
MDKNKELELPLENLELPKTRSREESRVDLKKWFEDNVFQTTPNPLHYDRMRNNYLGRLGIVSHNNEDQRNFLKRSVTQTKMTETILEDRSESSTSGRFSVTDSKRRTSERDENNVEHGSTPDFGKLLIQKKEKAQAQSSKTKEHSNSSDEELKSPFFNNQTVKDEPEFENKLLAVRQLWGDNKNNDILLTEYERADKEIRNKYLSKLMAGGILPKSPSKKHQSSRQTAKAYHKIQYIKKSSLIINNLIFSIICSDHFRLGRHLDGHYLPWQSRVHRC